MLSGISLYAKPGQKIAFVGSTGAGKTTIINLINRFYEIQGGRMVDRYHCGGYAVSVPRDPERDHITEERLGINSRTEKNIRESGLPWQAAFPDSCILTETYII